MRRVIVDVDNIDDGRGGRRPNRADVERPGRGDGQSSGRGAERDLTGGGPDKDSELHVLPAHRYLDR